MSERKSKKSKAGPQPGTPHPDRVSLRKWFGDLEVIEARHDIRIQPNEEDIKNAVPNDPTQCVFSQACRRMWSSNAVVFFGTVAYVDLLDKHGVRHVERFNISEQGKRFIREFDAGMTIAPKSFVLHAPSPRKTAAAINESIKEWKRKRKAILKGRAVGSKAKRPKRKPTGLRLSMFRNGMGMAQFPQTGAGK
jgi:hypothetical protein